MFRFQFQVQPGLPTRLPLSGGMAPPRVLMCSASMGAEGSVTLQLREAVQAPDSNGSPIDGSSVTIGYPDTDMLADMLGSIQAAGKRKFQIPFAVILSNWKKIIIESMVIIKNPFI